MTFAPFALKLVPAFLNIGFAELIILLAGGIIPIALIIYCVIDIVRSEFETANTRLLWLLIVLLAPFIGSLIYLAVGRSQKLAR
jgi:hypothetical protein